MIAIIDYGMGNLASVGNAFAKLGYQAVITQDPEEILTASQVVLPGVGAFADAIKNIKNRGIDQTIFELVNRQTPLLGVCLGYQLLFTESQEDGIHRGLDVIPGTVEKIKASPGYKVPHIGWNSVATKAESRLFTGIPTGSYFYFVHSYHVVPENQEVMAATTDYGIRIVCAVEENHIMATQFHPEKSGVVGLRILRNFGEM
ncbi:Glutamine amidotransferase [Syntrophomonas zehnderi OL-4]|uniref:Imidazole glycerol phosphate synthase subunit HisH n=1 Tax=Syntrophomonas zehnderi OL-4 TaxID=690567 RepID=A0A0E3W3T5_9FIRM|nr:imidazole glycerol phosphate synthase subunit HisH [Syntrophomonas zehnderi]CFY03788.1 Glutamine amidotransferase [Syntrophomonas zehnderi OL-4]